MKNRRSTGLTRLIAVCMVFAVQVSSSTFVLAAAGTKPVSAEIIVSGSNNSETPSVLLNGERAVSGRTFHTSGLVVTSEVGSAIINLGKLGRISLSPGSTLALSFTENNISGELSAGQMRVFNNEGVAVNIRTPDNVVTNDAAQGNLTVDVRSGTTQAVAESGSAYLDNGLTPAQQKDDDDDDDDMPGWVPFVVMGAIIGGVVFLTRGSEENVTSPVR